MEFNFDPATLTALAITYGTKLVAAVATLVIGLIIVRAIVGVFGKVLDRSGVDVSLRSFLLSLISMLLKAMVYITALGMLGVEMTSFVALIAAAGLAVGMALSGTLQNFAGGVMILLFKPYKIGDFVEAQGYAGVVKDIQIFTTILTTGDNKTVLIPNGGLATGSLINYSTQPRRRVDFIFGIGYGDDLDKAYEVLGKLIEADDRILKDPEPFMALHALADSSVNIVVRVWVEAGDYWGVYFNMNEQVYRSFGNEGLSIPYPQMDVHVQPADG
ncbi:MAG: mechanosensitive ion channel [Gammaproteobacteria bacterium]|jgi:small conductance mechanosensitive channel|nr:mechanosensitive ion channel [Gammaproteobacteria bacterium]MBT3860196.1 mechanosensitive ion channel [Gammaproteobacteria bacterium]MBT3987488.1 mechanosensitive ion channel [Gammaproteobacteria bacterium]MBT4255334.1 mechanosensitive ion channel [Gammaproteobacteria bacterium]MBT4581774.1 mechanosensitive ion channel [Gammaproteobacteria bacterium]